MGFGLLFFGYAAAYLMSLNPFGYIFALMGCAVMMSGLSKLSEFEIRFRYAYTASVILAFLAMAMSVASILPQDIAGENTFSYLLAAFLIVSIPFHALIYFAIGKIAGDVGIIGLKRRALNYALLGCMELILSFAAWISWYFGAAFAKYLVIAAVIYPVLIIILNLALFYSCYKNICEEGDEEAPRKPSRIPFLNKLFDAAEKREQEIYEKTKSYAENKIKQDNEKKKNRKKKK